MNDSHKPLIITFNPWLFVDTNQLISQFFLRLSRELKGKTAKLLYKIGVDFVTHARQNVLFRILPGMDKPAKVFSGLGEVFKRSLEGSDLSEQKRKIAQLLKKQEHRIYIIIDDIDRLNNEQIRQVFQLVTAIADFPNIVYILAFDKEIVTRALREVQEGDGEEYLEKVIQIPIQVPDIKKSELRQVLFEYINEIRKDYKDTSFLKGYWDDIYMSCIDPLIISVRDVNRLCNLVQFKLSAISAEVNYVDMIMLSTIELFLPNIYEWIKQSKEDLTKKDLVPGNRKNRDTEFYLAKFSELLSAKTCSKNNITNEFVFDLISKVFPVFGEKFDLNIRYEYNELRKSNNIAHPEKFDRYFQLNPDYVEIKRNSIIDAIHTNSVETFKRQLKDYNEKGAVYNFLQEINANITDMSESNIRVVVQSLLETLNELISGSNNIFTVSSKNYARHIIMNLLCYLSENKRFEFIKLCFNLATEDTISSFAYFLYLLNNQGIKFRNEHDSKIYLIVTSEELNELNQIFLIKCKKLLSLPLSLFDILNWTLVYYLLEIIDKEYIKEYLNDILDKDKNKLLYLDITINSYSDGTYVLIDEYQKYLTVEQIIHAITSHKEECRFFNLPETIQKKCCVFILYLENDMKQREFSITEVEQVLRTLMVK